MKYFNVVFCIFLLFIFNPSYAKIKTGLPNNDLSYKHTQHENLQATTYFINPTLGNDQNSGKSKKQAFKTLAQIQKINFHPGDQIFLADGQVYNESLNLVNIQGDKEQPIEIKSVKWNDDDQDLPAIIDFKGKENGILIQDCSFIQISNIELTADGYSGNNESLKMRCGIIITDVNKPKMTNIDINHVVVKDVYYENPGFSRGKKEVHSANGTQKYGWGIRVINKDVKNLIENVQISNCIVKNVSHTGIMLTGNNKNIKQVKIINNSVSQTGGPGIQMSDVQFVYVAKNIIDHSGSSDDSRKWGRGSGLWTWGSSDVLIEKNQFLNANGPGDSDGAHIDFNCDNVVIQYNLSVHNAGGFCEILGNDYNCAYRYNVSVNDGYRVKGKNNAFQEGKILWLSGFVGAKAARKGPVNTYIYNNTIYCDSTIYPKIAIDNTSSGILIANNIFYLKNNIQLVLGDQYKPDKNTGLMADNVLFKNNLFLSNKNWPKNIAIQDKSSVFGNPDFSDSKTLGISSFIPKNTQLVNHRGISIPYLANDEFGLINGLKIKKDILGNPITGMPSIGAIQNM